MKQAISSPPFITVSELAEFLTERNGVSLIDARAERAYAVGHLPEAVNLPARDLNAPKGSVRQLIGRQALKDRLRERGIGAGSVVVYGERGGSDAAHVWWTLHAYGHPAVYILDGGIEAWQAAGLELSTATPSVEPPETPFEPEFDAERLIALDELEARLADPHLAIVDTRYEGEFIGEDVAAKHGGHIPRARLVPWDELLTEGRLKPDDMLRMRLKPFLQVPEVALYCQSGVRAAHTYAVLKKLGHPNPRLYLGSWAEWGDRDDTPISKDKEVGE
jgi:thiosulfate/3-mercaptopyruvate sulfurtransferase